MHWQSDALTTRLDLIRFFILIYCVVDLDPNPVDPELFNGFNFNVCIVYKRSNSSFNYCTRYMYFSF